MTSFDYRRRLEREDWIRLLGAAAGAATAIGGVVLYFGRLWLQRVPLERADDRRGAGARLNSVSRPDPRVPDSRRWRN